MASLIQFFTSLIAPTPLQADIALLKVAQKSRFANLSFDQISKMGHSKKEYKKKPSNEYFTFVSLLKQARETKLPFRIVEIAKRCLSDPERNGEDRNFLMCCHFEMPQEPQSKEQRKEFLVTFKKCIMDLFSPYEGTETIKLLEQMQWVHGTKSALLPMLRWTGYRMTSTGDLLNDGLAPMSGELKLGGMKVNGANQKALSAETIRNIKRTIDYAEGSYQSFVATKFQDPDMVFKSTLDLLKKSYPADNEWDQHILLLLQLKQWDPDTFERLLKKYASEIQAVLKETSGKLSYQESMIEKAIHYPIEKLRGDHEEVEREFPALADFPNNKWYKASIVNPVHALMEAKISSDQYFINANGWKHILFDVINFRLFQEEVLETKKSTDPIHRYVWGNIEDRCGSELNAEIILKKCVSEPLQSRQKMVDGSLQMRFERLKSVFERPAKVRFSKEEREWIEKPFPVLIASTKSSCQMNGNKEANVTSAILGKEADVILVYEKDITAVRTWLKEHSLEKLVQVHTIESIKPFLSLPLYHASHHIQ